MERTGKRKAARNRKPGNPPGTWLDRLPPTAGAVLFGAMVGGALGCLFLLVGLARAALVLLGGATLEDEEFVRPALFYVGGFTAGGALAGLLWPLHAFRGGIYVIGSVMMTVVMAACVYSQFGPVSSWGVLEWIMVPALGVLFGCALARGFTRGA